MILKRKIYDELLKWKNEEKGAKALLIEGARRIGKSTVCREFGKNEYKSYIEINFSKVREEVKEYFYNYLENLDDLFMLLSNNYGITLYERDTLFIFDEVQAFPRAREAIKFLVEDGRYDYLETGSLISIRENVEGIVIPSEERQIKMYPLDFEEFANALGQSMLISYIKKCFEDKKPLDRLLHNKAMFLFNQYILVGGMPKVVSCFLENNKQFEEVDKEKRDILNLYRNDIMKIKSRYREKVLSIFDDLPSLLSKHEKRIIFSDIQKGSYGEQYKDTFFWLQDSMIANECFRCTDPNVGFSLNLDSSCVKCYLGDTGLLVSHTFDENRLISEGVYSNILNGKLSINEGMFYENVIAQMLVANGHRLFFYTKYNNEAKRNDIEIDFLISTDKVNPRISPIEVKSGERYTHKSISKFIEKYKDRINNAYIIHPRNLVVHDGLICIPPYMTICLK